MITQYAHARVLEYDSTVPACSMRFDRERHCVKNGCINTAHAEKNQHEGTTDGSTISSN